MSLTADQINMTAATNALQTLALGGLTVWLDAKQNLPGPSPAGLDDIAAVLADQSNLTHMQKSAVGRLSRRFLISEPPKWSVAQMRWIGDNFSAGPLRGTFAWIKDTFARLIGPGPVRFNPIAPALVDALAQEAFCAPAFRRSVSALIRQHARGRVIMHPDNGRPAMLGGPTFWAAAAEGAHALDNKLLRTQLTKKASQAVDAYGWAGFWDSYLFQQARAAGCDMPETDLTLHLTPQPDTPPQFRHAWRDDVPGYGPQLIENTL